jgi:BolA family transcriptional regulator, general stress-responsive regulator
MTTKNIIEDKLNQQFSPNFLSVDNESHMHNVPAGSESHFKVVVVSDEFNDKRLVQRHRLINQCLAEELKNGIHALAIHTFTDKEWTDKQDKEMQSPQCAGGGK